jgi:SAM-dependent methyltransferase
LDLNLEGIRASNALAERKKLGPRCRFQQGDASQSLPFADGSLDAVFSNDVLCHVPGRGRVLREIFRVLKPGGRLLFSDALVVGGIISHEEIAMRSSIGYYRFQFVAVEGETNFQVLQRFLDCVHKLTSERRLLRVLYVASR